MKVGLSYESSISSQIDSVGRLRKCLIKSGVPLDDLYKQDLVEMNYNSVK
jgi:hypothetical protein